MTVSPNSPGIGRGSAVLRTTLTWLLRLAAALFILLSLCLALQSLILDSALVGYLFTEATALGLGSILQLQQLSFAVIAVIGIGFSLLNRRLVAAVLFSVLVWPTFILFTAMQCDVYPGCEWAARVPIPGIHSPWSVQLRPVTDAQEARDIASSALHKHSFEYRTYTPRQFADHWIVPTINEDGRPGPFAVRVDTRSGRSSIVECPSQVMLCGMEWPRISDADVPFENAALGISAAFPAGWAVCVERVDQEERGFYAVKRDPEEPCDIHQPDRTIGLAASSKPSLEKALEPIRANDCSPLSVEVMRAFGGQVPEPASGRHAICEQRSPPSDAPELNQIAVVLLVEHEASTRTGRGPALIYEAWLVTHPDHLSQDAVLFRSFLEAATLDGQPIVRNRRAP